VFYGVRGLVGQSPPPHGDVIQETLSPSYFSDTIAYWSTVAGINSTSPNDASHNLTPAPDPSHDEATSQSTSVLADTLSYLGHISIGHQAASGEAGAPEVHSASSSPNPDQDEDGNVKTPSSILSDTLAFINNITSLSGEGYGG
jgi:hypothetical protein